MFGHLAMEAARRHHVAESIAEPEPLISREEVVGTLFNIADIAAEAWLIRRLLEENGEEEDQQGAA